MTRLFGIYTDIQLKTFIHGMEVFNRKIIMRRDSVILSKSRNRLRQRRNLSDERIESENSITSAATGPGGQGCPPLQRNPLRYLGCILPTANAPGQQSFLRCAASFSLKIRQYSCGKSVSHSTKIPRCRSHFQFFRYTLRKDKIPAQGETGVNSSCGKVDASSSATK